MSKTWRIAVVVLLAAAIVTAVALKSQKDRSEPKRPISTVASESAAPEPQTPETPKAEQPVPTTSQETKPPVTATKPPVATQTIKPIVKPDKPSTASPAPPKPAPRPKHLPKLIDVGAESCIPCKMMVPVLKELKEQYASKLEVVFVDVRKDPAAAEKHAVRLIPTQIFFDAKGKEFYRHQGFFSKEEILAKFKEKGIKL
jgi:thioredoxin 1